MLDPLLCGVSVVFSLRTRSYPPVQSPPQFPNLPRLSSSDEEQDQADEHHDEQPEDQQYGHSYEPFSQYYGYP